MTLPLARFAATAALAFAIALEGATVSALAADFARPGEKQKCPVCGMFVARYPDWVCQILFKDGDREVFDGAKDFFRFLLDMKGFGGKRGPADVAAVFVTDYYSLEPIDGKGASYVIGSDVYGPMGRELIPFARRADAEEFLRDYGGRILGFDKVPAELGGLVE